jgi:outer membrane immunogenic protein
MVLWWSDVGLTFRGTTMMYRHLAITAIAAGLGSGLVLATASAADLGAPAPAPIYTKAPMAVPFSWTGFYVGGNVGYGWGTARDDPSFSQPGTDPAFLATFDESDSDKVNGVIGGAQAGYNWQVNNFVLGLETDIQGSVQKGTDTFDSVIQFLGLSGSDHNPASVVDANKLDWFGTTRARLGLAVDRWLVYGTGGVAYGEVNQSGNIQPGVPAGFTPAQVQNAPIVWDQSSTKVGWAAGAGVENAINRNWSWKLEYLYMDLGTATANVSGGVGTAVGLPHNCYGSTGFSCTFFNAAAGSVTSHFTDNILRVGVNYRFN